MRKIFAPTATVAIAVVILVLVFGSNDEAAKIGIQQVPNGYDLVWSDDFGGVELDDSKWIHRGLGIRNGGVISPNSSFVDGAGHLVIETSKVGNEYHSGMISTQRFTEFKYGYFEARVKFPAGAGQTSAFWLQSRGNTAGISPPAKAGIEVDIIEFYRGRGGGWAANALHWGAYAENHQVEIRRTLLQDDLDWHTFGFLWTEHEYVFFADGKETWRTRQSISHAPEYIILSTVIAKRSEVLERAGLPNQFLVDYVRVYGSADTVVPRPQKP